MTFKYNPSDALACWPEGEYEATIEHVEEGASKKTGLPMLTVKFKAYNSKGQTQLIDDYIVNPSTLFKLKGIAKALGAESEFNAGEFDLAEHIGSNVRLALTVEKSADFDDKNKVRKYLPLARVAATASASSHEVEQDEDIPF